MPDSVATLSAELSKSGLREFVRRTVEDMLNKTTACWNLLPSRPLLSLIGAMLILGAWRKADYLVIYVICLNAVLGRSI